MRRNGHTAAGLSGWGVCVAAAVVLVAGCSQVTPVPTPSATTPSPTPLATAEMAGVGVELPVRGTLRLVDGCVYLDEPEWGLLVVVAPATATWDPASNELLYEDASYAVGDRLTITGLLVEPGGPQPRGSTVPAACDTSSGFMLGIPSRDV